MFRAHEVDRHVRFDSLGKLVCGRCDLYLGYVGMIYMSAPFSLESLGTCHYHVVALDLGILLDLHTSYWSAAFVCQFTSPRKQ